MNHITINGTIVKDATKALVNNVGTETPVVTFTLMDSGKMNLCLLKFILCKK